MIDIAVVCNDQKVFGTFLYATQIPWDKERPGSSAQIGEVRFTRVHRAGDTEGRTFTGVIYLTPCEGRVHAAINLATREWAK